MSIKPHLKRNDRGDKKINELDPSELKARLYSFNSEFDADVLHKAADVLFNEDICGSLFLQMKKKDFKEIGLTFGCRSVVLKYRDELTRKSVRASIALPPLSPLKKPVGLLTIQETAEDAIRASRAEGEVPMNLIKNTAFVGENTWEVPELDLPSPTLTQSNELAQRRSDLSKEISDVFGPKPTTSSIFEKPPTGSTLKGALMGERSAIKSTGSAAGDKRSGVTEEQKESTYLEDDKLGYKLSLTETSKTLERNDRLADTETVQTDVLFDSVEKYLRSEISGKINSSGDDFEDIKEDAPLCIDSPCGKMGIQRSLSSPTRGTRVKWQAPKVKTSSETHKRARTLNDRRLSKRIPKVKPQPSATESFELLVDPKRSTKITERITLAKLREQNRILTEGYYEKAHGHREKWKKLGWDARYGVLLNNGLLVYFAELPLEKQGRMGFRRIVNLSDLEKVEVQVDKNDWRLKIHAPNSSHSTHLFRFASEREMTEWRDFLLEAGGLVPSKERKAK